MIKASLGKRAEVLPWIGRLLPFSLPTPAFLRRPVARIGLKRGVGGVGVGGPGQAASP